MDILSFRIVSVRSGVLFFLLLFMMTGCAGRSADYKEATGNHQFGNVAFTLPAAYQLSSKRVVIQGMLVEEFPLGDKTDGSGIDDVLKVCFSSISLVQALVSEKGFNNNIKDVSEEFGVPARWMLSSVLQGEEELIISIHIVQESNVYLVLIKADADLDIDGVHNSAKLLHSLYRPEAGEGTKDFAITNGFFRGLLSTSIPFTYEVTYRSQLSSDYILIDYGGKLKHFQLPLPTAMSAVLHIHPAAYFLLPDEERNHEYEIDGIKGYEVVVEDQGLFVTMGMGDRSIFEWWGKVPSPAGEGELTLKIVSASTDSKAYDSNLKVWDHLLKTITVRR